MRSLKTVKKTIAVTAIAIAIFIFTEAILTIKYTETEVPKSGGKLHLSKRFAKNSEDESIILYWTKWWGWDPLDSVIVEDPASCLEKCRYVHARRDLLEISDAILFHPADMALENLTDLPNYRNEDQVWVIVHRETPIRQLRPSSKQIEFNWTMTYRRDSDVYHPHFQTLPLLQNEAELGAKAYSKTWNVLKKKSKLVLWFASNCGGQRFEYVKELQKYIPVDIFGKCGNQNQNQSDSIILSSKEGWTHVSGPPKAWSLAQKQYKFYLSFENSNCTDYVTEKLRNPLMWDILPVVMGGGDYDAIAPPGSFINVKDYASPKELAEYLMYLHENPGEFAKYFEWKRRYRINHHFSGWCNLCKKLREKKRRGDKNRKSFKYEDFLSWYYATRVEEIEGVIKTKPGMPCSPFYLIMS